MVYHDRDCATDHQPPGRRTGALARPSEKGYRLEGTIPWATAAGKANFIIAGAATEDGKQILFALPMDMPGIVVHAPLPLVALLASWTTTVECRDVELDARWVFRGPVEKVLSGRNKSVPIGQAFLAFGLCRGGLNLIAKHDSDRGRTLLAKMEEQLRTLREDVIAECQPGKTPDPAAQAHLAVRAMIWRCASPSRRSRCTRARRSWPIIPPSTCTGSNVSAGLGRAPIPSSIAQSTLWRTVHCKN